MHESKDTEARLTIIEYRQDQGEKGLLALRTEYTQEHQALRKTLQGIEKNLQTIKYVACGAGLMFLANTIGLDKAVSILTKVI